MKKSPNIFNRIIDFYKEPEKFLSQDIIERRDFFIKNARAKTIDVGMQDGYFVRELKKNDKE